MKDIKINGQSYLGIKQIQLPTVQGGTALFEDIDGIKPSGGVLNFVETARAREDEIYKGQYWVQSNFVPDKLYQPKYDYGILLVDWLNTHKKENSKQGIQTQLFVYTPTAICYMGWGYRNNTGPQVDYASNVKRTSSQTNIKTDLVSVAGKTIFTGYINEETTGAVATQAKLDKQSADALMLIMSGSVGYTA